MRITIELWDDTTKVLDAEVMYFDKGILTIFDVDGWEYEYQAKDLYKIELGDNIKP